MPLLAVRSSALSFNDDDEWGDPDPGSLYCGYCRYFPCICDYNLSTKEYYS